jgi:hypothetical protein
MDDHYLVHIDRVDPQKDPIGHLIEDAPQVIVAGAVCVCAYIIFRALQKEGGPGKQKAQ